MQQKPKGGGVKRECVRRTASAAGDLKPQEAAVWMRLEAKRHFVCGRRAQAVQLSNVEPPVCLALLLHTGHSGLRFSQSLVQSQ